MPDASRDLATATRVHPLELAFWLATLLPFFLFPSYLVLASQIAITALFALSLDLILGYAGIVSLGHAAYFGVGAYAAALLAVHGWGEPISGLAAGIAVAAIAGMRARFSRIARSESPNGEATSRRAATNTAKRTANV